VEGQNEVVLHLQNFRGLIYCKFQGDREYSVTPMLDTLSVPSYGVPAKLVTPRTLNRMYV